MSERRGIPLVKEFESCRLKAYQDSVGVWTIGWGETKGIHAGMVWTQQQADETLAKRYDEFEDAVLRAVKVKVDENELGALTCFTYNVGIGAFQKSSVLRELNAGNEVEAADALLQWDKAGGKVLGGLLRRRKAERALFLKE
ncbi:MAG: lysozyme [Legionella sp.]|uniref:lysozyme n=1 Tax=Legionella sp. TaxID=459 RepID=UPI002848ED00|nr:lysozyme [Legionella sp.]